MTEICKGGVDGVGGGIDSVFVGDGAVHSRLGEELGIRCAWRYLSYYERRASV